LQFAEVGYLRRAEGCMRPVHAFKLVDEEGNFQAFDPRRAIEVAAWLRHAAHERARGLMLDTSFIESFVCGHGHDAETKNNRFSYLPLPTIPVAGRDGRIRRGLLVEPFGSANGKAQAVTRRLSLSGVGFDPYRGFFHKPRYGRPALALDIMEPFRPILADSAVITAINNGEIKPGDFVWAGRACALSPSGRKKMIAAFERRLAAEITHPVFGYRLSYRRLLEVHARLLGRHLMGEIPELPPIEPR
jgi:hypothetical protein